MDTKNLTLEIADAVERLLGSDYSVSANDVTKNNGLILTGLNIKRKGLNISPTIYINQYFDLYKSGVTIDTIAGEIIEIYKENDISSAFDVSSITDYEKARSRIIFQLVNTERNAALLETVPSVKFLDFSIIFKIHFGNFHAGNATTTITNRMLDLWNVGTETIYKDALENTPVLQEYSLKSMTETLLEMGLNPELYGGKAKIANSDFLYILTNRQCSCGCGCILYPHVLEDFAEKIGMGFFILPSSRHEVLLAPGYCQDADYLLEMVREINRTKVAREDFLSDNVYYYSRETKEIIIIQ